MLFKLARKIMAKKLSEDLGTHQAYRANIAMCIYDNRRKDGRLNKEDCNRVAIKLIDKVFE